MIEAGKQVGIELGFNHGRLDVYMISGLLDSIRQIQREDYLEQVRTTALVEGFKNTIPAQTMTGTAMF